MMCLVTNRQTLAAIAIRGEHSYTKDKSGLNFTAALWVLLLFFFKNCSLKSAHFCVFNRIDNMTL